MRTPLLFLLIAATSDMVLAQPRPNLRLGLWRIDIEMTLPGKGPNTNGAVTQEVCLTAANIAQVVMPKDPYCDGRVTKQTSSEMDWRMQCKHEATETFSRAHIEFSDTKFASAILTTAKPYNMEFRTVVRGQYTGACSAEQTRQALSPVQNPPDAKASKPSVPERPPAALAPYKP